MLNRETLLLAAQAIAAECRRASEAEDLPRLIDHADALKAIDRALLQLLSAELRDFHTGGVA